MVAAESSCGGASRRKGVWATFGGRGPGPLDSKLGRHERQSVRCVALVCVSVSLSVCIGGIE